VLVLVLAGGRRGWSWPAATGGGRAAGGRPVIAAACRGGNRENGAPGRASASESGANAGRWLKG
jgi:hypothetical protein